MVRVALKPSCTVAIVFIAAHLAAACSVLPLDLTVTIKVTIAASCAASLAYTLLRHAWLKLPHSIVAVEIHDQQSGAFLDRRGEWQEARVLATTYVSATLTVLNLRATRHRLARHALLVVDNTAPDEFRRARVLLRWRRPAPARQDGADESSTDAVSPA